MCEFISWIEKDGKCIFLTGEDVFKTKRGKELQAHDGTGDLDGHGAIRWYYNFKGGVDKECTDFSTPDNFPLEIVKAIKSGKMRGLGTAKGLLTPEAITEYEKIEQSAYAEYEKIALSAYAGREKIEQLAFTLAEYERIVQSAYTEYDKIRQSAYAKYKKVKQTAFWDLFAVKKNRVKAWR